MSSKRMKILIFNFIIFNFNNEKGIRKLNVENIKNSFGGNENNISNMVFENNFFKEVNHEKENEINFKEFKNMMYINYFISL